jgi:hypothetical protein
MSVRTSYLLAEDPLTDLQIVEAMTSELEDYIVKGDLYRTLIVRIPGADQNLQMTGGDLLTRLHRLQTVRHQLTPDGQIRLEKAQKSVSETIYSLRTRFHARLQREMKARLDSLKWFLDDCALDQPRCRVEFPFEIRNRQRIEEILKELAGDVPEELRQLLRGIDQRIRLLARPADFIWDTRLKLAFPRNPYWYLYLSP